MNPSTPEPPVLSAPPWVVLRARLLEHVARLTASGDTTGAAVLHALVEGWWRDQTKWSATAREVLRATHEINNALVGVSGSAQLLLLGPPGQQNGVRERLQVVMREAERVERAVQRLQLLRSAFDAAPGDEAPPAAPRRDRNGDAAANAA